MKKHVFSLYFLVFFIFSILFIFYTFPRTISVKSKIDGNYYHVKNINSQESADLFGSINLKILKLIEYLWKEKDRKYLFFKKYIIRLKTKYKPHILSENIDHNYTSYSLDKRHIFLCVRQRDNKKDKSFVDENTLMYVVLHELSHFVADKTITEEEHYTDQEFKSIFATLIKASSEIDIYEPIPFSSNPTPYCGITIY